MVVVLFWWVMNLFFECWCPGSSMSSPICHLFLLMIITCSWPLQPPPPPRWQVEVVIKEEEDHHSPQPSLCFWICPTNLYFVFYTRHLPWGMLMWHHLYPLKIHFHIFSCYHDPMVCIDWRRCSFQIYNYLSLLSFVNALVRVWIPHIKIVGMEFNLDLLLVQRYC
jgi:hypothetical protein